MTRRKRPATLAVRAYLYAGTWIARKHGAAANSTSSAAMAVRRLADKLGYPAAADVRFVRLDAAGAEHYEIVEIDRVRG